MLRRIFAVLLSALLLFSFAMSHAEEKIIRVSSAEYPVTENGVYTSMEEVAVYLETFKKLPSNFITKKAAGNLGWSNREGNLTQVAPGCSIGGDYFGNYEGNVPNAPGRRWTECDINYVKGYRNGERIVFSNDGLIYYSDDHYNTFTRVEVYEGTENKAASGEKSIDISKDGTYIAAEEVAAYLHEYNCLPPNYITREEAKALGWSNKQDNLGQVAPGRTIGGDVFQNREKQLPVKKGRVWHECDVDTADGSRSKKHVIYSTDGLIYYTPDNHKSFIQLY